MMFARYTLESFIGSDDASTTCMGLGENSNVTGKCNVQIQNPYTCTTSSEVIFAEAVILIRAYEVYVGLSTETSSRQRDGMYYIKMFISLLARAVGMIDVPKAL